MARFLRNIPELHHHCPIRRVHIRKRDSVRRLYLNMISEILQFLYSLHFRLQQDLRLILRQDSLPVHVGDLRLIGIKDVHKLCQSADNPRRPVGLIRKRLAVKVYICYTERKDYQGGYHGRHDIANHYFLLYRHVFSNISFVLL